MPMGCTLRLGEQEGKGWGSGKTPRLESVLSPNPLEQPPWPTSPRLAMGPGVTGGLRRDRNASA